MMKGRALEWFHDDVANGTLVRQRREVETLKSLKNGDDLVVERTIKTSEYRFDCATTRRLSFAGNVKWARTKRTMR